MSIKIIQGDLLEQTGYIVQQCNCVTTKALGLAKSIAEKFGNAGDVYTDRKVKSTPGTILIKKYNDEISIVHLFAQWFPGKSSKSDSSQDRLEYFKLCLNQMLLECNGLPVYFPYKIGCGLADGKWSSYFELIADFATKYNGRTYIVKMP